MTKPESSSLFATANSSSEGPVECLGMTFENDAARRQHFLEKLREKLKDQEFCKIDGFPIDSDEDVLAMSDPPYYTACPNPFLKDFVEHYGKPYDPSVPYNRKPFAVDVSEGKTDPVYRAHAYHTKVPHLAIVPSILHYTEPGDIVLDGFCGSGMTGVAAQWCGTAPESYRRELEAAWKREGLGKPAWGVRRSVQCDLSPAATFIAANYNLPFDVEAFAQAGRKLLDEVEHELGWMYETLHTDGTTKGRIEYTVWSEVFTCPNCAGEVVFLDEALDKKTKRVREAFPCPHCGGNLTKDNLERVFETRFDPAMNCTWKRITFRPSLLSYVANGQRHEKQPDKQDLILLERIAQLDLPPELPTNRFPVEQMYHGSRIEPKGFTHVHHFFLARATHALAALWRKAKTHPETRIRHMLLFFVEQGIRGMSLLNRYKPIQYGRIGGSQVGLDMPGVYYISSISSEVSPWYQFEGKLSRLTKAFTANHSVDSASLITTGDASRLELPSSSIDYIFTDPPFGENIYYADLNFLVESWHRVLTNAEPEAIVDRAKHKTLADYQWLMKRCFEEYYRVLKPGRWMTVVFHNSRNAVWNAIQEAMLAAGFVVADVRTLDKQQGSYRQVTSTAVKQDLVISAYKPDGGLEERFQLEAGTEEGVWDFVRTHLKQLPVFVTKNGQAETIAERQNYLLFDRMVAFHVQRGVTVPLSAAEFYQGLAERFPERDGMYFLPEQTPEYDKKRMTVQEVLQLDLFVIDESSAIQWLKQQLAKKPQTFQELQPQFMREVAGWEKHEKPLELSDILQENFLCYDGNGEAPGQIHSYLSSNFHELRNLAKDDPKLIARARNRWYVPDPRKEADLEKIRHRALMREFEAYKQSKGRLRVVRTEALRAGFKECWQHGEYRTIVDLAKRVRDQVIQEDPALLMYYDNAMMRTGE